jgi:hypothetical protein
MPADDDHIPAFAVIRLDLFSLQAEPELSVKVVEVLPDHDSAAAEAARLNQLNQGKATTYLTQATRWYPYGRQPGTPPQDSQDRPQGRS